MDVRPSFRNRADLRQLVLALVVPWLLGGLAWCAPLIDRQCYRAGISLDWLRPLPMIWFYAFGFAAGLIIPVLFLLGVRRLVLRREYRQSWYGWAWLVLMWLNLCGVTSVIGT